MNFPTSCSSLFRIVFKNMRNVERQRKVCELKKKKRRLKEVNRLIFELIIRHVIQYI